jgi:REP element-mobilizing transposase RayT
MRRARHKSSESTFYHVFTRVAGAPGFKPFEDPEAWLKLYAMIMLLVQVYGCRLVSLTIMDTHYHLIVWMEKFRRLPLDELQRRAALLWGAETARLKAANWGREAWDRFNRQLFDLSAMMQRLNGEYAKWYNLTHERTGHFWGDRFKNTELLDLEAVQQCLAYIETNATRKHLAERPEQWERSSTWMRFRHQDEHLLMPLEEIFAGVPSKEVFTAYRRRLEERQRVDQEKEREAKLAAARGRLGGRERFFLDGIAIGSRENVARVLEGYQAKGRYLKRRNPIPQADGRLFSLREQRSHARG